MRRVLHNIWSAIPSKLFGAFGWVSAGAIALWPDKAKRLLESLMTPEQIRFWALFAFAIFTGYWIVWFLLRPKTETKASDIPPPIRQTAYDPIASIDVSEGVAGGAKVTVIGGTFVGVRQMLRARGMGDTHVENTEHISEMAHIQGQYPTIDPAIIDAFAEALKAQALPANLAAVSVQPFSDLARVDLIRKLAERGIMVREHGYANEQDLPTVKPLEYRYHQSGWGAIYVDAKP